jgi:hypothetical protein
LVCGEEAVILATEFYNNDKLLQYWTCKQDFSHANKKTKTGKEGARNANQITYLSIPQGRKFSNAAVDFF